MKYLIIFIIFFWFASGAFAQAGGQELPKEITEGQDERNKGENQTDEMLQMGPKLRPKEKKKLKKILQKYSLNVKEKAVIGKNESGALLTGREKRMLARAQRKKIILREKIHAFSVQKNFDHQSKEVKKRMIANRKRSYKYGSRTDRRTWWEKMFPPKKIEYKQAPKDNKQPNQQENNMQENK